jgi:hypothetical protein
MDREIAARLASIETTLGMQTQSIEMRAIARSLPKRTEMANPVMVNPGSYASLGSSLAASGFIGPLDPAELGSYTPPAANTALFVPFFITQAETVRKMFVANSATVSGNIDVGIYTDRPDGQVERLVSNGGTAQAGAGDFQELAIQNLVLRPGRYYLAVALDNDTGYVQTFTPYVVTWLSGIIPQASGCARMDDAYPLPKVATLAAYGAAGVPFVGVSFRDLVA